MVHVDALPEQESTMTGSMMRRDEAEALCRSRAVPSTTPLVNIAAFRRCVEERMDGR